MPPFLQACSTLGVVRQLGPGHLTIELIPPQPCEGCSGACMWYRVPASAQLTLPVNDPIPVGATVAVTLPDRYLLGGAALLYGLPLAALLVGAVTAAALVGTDIAAAVGGGAAMLAALLAASPLRRQLERKTLRHLTVHLSP